MRIAAQAFRQVAAIPVQELVKHPGSRTTSVVVDLGNIETQGAPDSWMGVCLPEDMEGNHWLFACQDPVHPEQFIYRLVVTESALKGEVWLTPRTTQQLADWAFDTAQNTRLRSLPVQTIAALQLGEDRHSLGMLSKLTSFNEVISFLAKVQAENKAQVVVMAAGAWQALLKSPGPLVHSEEAIREAHVKCVQLSELLERSNCLVALPGPDEKKRSRNRPAGGGSA